MAINFHFDFLSINIRKNTKSSFYATFLTLNSDGFDDVEIQILFHFLSNILEGFRSKPKIREINKETKRLKCTINNKLLYRMFLRR